MSNSDFKAIPGQPRHPEVTVQLVGEDGNIFSIMGRVCHQMRRARVSEYEIREFANQVTSAGSYDKALQIVMSWVETE